MKGVLKKPRPARWSRAEYEWTESHLLRADDCDTECPAKESFYGMSSKINHQEKFIRNVLQNQSSNISPLDFVHNLVGRLPWYAATYFYIVVLEGHEEGEKSLGRDPEGLQQVPLLEYPGDDHDKCWLWRRRQCRWVIDHDQGLMTKDQGLRKRRTWK